MIVSKPSPGIEVRSDLGMPEGEVVVVSQPSELHPERNPRWIHLFFPDGHRTVPMGSHLPSAEDLVMRRADRVQKARARWKVTG
jgi:hypothetical protein